MIVSTPIPDQNAGPVVIVFGSGLIGTAFGEELAARFPMRSRIVASNWAAGPGPRDDFEVLAQVARDCRRRVGSYGSSPRLVVLWSAGRAAFNATAPEVETELATFRAAIEILTANIDGMPRSSVRFGLISSAGGLFEGERSVGPLTPPRPRRAYGFFKLRQEEILTAQAERLEPRIYRLTSVYGHLAPRARRGLIPTLVLDGLKRRVTRITGHAETLRDFVWVEDVARFLVGDLASSESSGSLFTLASTKPSSIHEIQLLVERTLGHRLYVTYSGSASNSEHITFAPGGRPQSWQTSDLACTTRQIYMRALSRGLA